MNIIQNSIIKSVIVAVLTTTAFFIFASNAFAVAPTFFAGNIFDSDDDGTVDRINVVFTSGFTSSDLGAGEITSDWTYSGGSVGGSLGTATAQGSTIISFVIVGANPGVTGGAMPTMSYDNDDADDSISNVDGAMGSVGPISLNDGANPVIVSISSDKADGSYTVGEVIDIDVTFSEPVESTGNVTVTLETGDIDQTCTFALARTATGTCDYTVQTGDQSADLEATVTGTVNDGYYLTLTNFIPTTTLAASKALVIDAAVVVVSEARRSSSSTKKSKAIAKAAFEKYYDTEVGETTTPTTVTTKTTTDTSLLSNKLTKKGAKGDAVKQLQNSLNAHGATLTPDGIFGPMTLQAVKAFQSANGLDADGIVGPKTLDNL